MEQLAILRNGEARACRYRYRPGMKKRREKPKTHPLTPRVGHPRLKIAVKRSALLDYALFDGEAEEFGIVGEAEVLHDAVFVKGDGASGYVEDGGGFFHGVAFGEELQDFALARRQHAANLLGPRFARGEFPQSFL